MTLASQQQALLSLLLGRTDALPALLAQHDSSSTARGLQAYRANAHELAARALQAAYPVVAQLLGEESFADLARAFWHAHPPACGDMARWGARLPAFLQISEQLAEEAYLCDVARVEWALHQATSATDADAEPATLALMMTHDPSMLFLALAPGAAVIASAYPIASIVTAHLQGEPTLEEAGRRLRAGLAEAALVWRKGFKPCVRQMDGAEAAFVTAVLQGRALEEALQEALHGAPAFDFNTWLPNAVQSGLLLAVRAGADETPCGDPS